MSSIVKVDKNGKVTLIKNGYTVRWLPYSFALQDESLADLGPDGTNDVAPWEGVGDIAYYYQNPPGRDSGTGGTLLGNVRAQFTGTPAGTYTGLRIAPSGASASPSGVGPYMWVVHGGHGSISRPNTEDANNPFEFYPVEFIQRTQHAFLDIVLADGTRVDATHPFSDGFQEKDIISGFWVLDISQGWD